MPIFQHAGRKQQEKIGIILILSWGKKDSKAKNNIKKPLIPS